MNITVIGIGYVGLSLAVMMSAKHHVTALEINPDRVEKLNHRISPIQDTGIEEWLKTKVLDLFATSNPEEALKSAEFVIIAVPTNYDDVTHRFDVSAVDSVLKQIHELNPKAVVVIKSTIPVGYTHKVSSVYPDMVILFSPEFLRESKALFDNLYPSRIVVGYAKPRDEENARRFAELLSSCAEKTDVPVLLIGANEAEAIKLFSNTYLALRVAYFNELDSYAIHYGLNPREIIDGVCLDPRIGEGYNNPSFGYGGYCLPKDTKQLLHNFHDVPQNLIGAIVKSNDTRKQAIGDAIIEEAKKRAKDPVIGIYRLTMKAGSDNFRQSAILDIIERLRGKGFRIVIYEPTLRQGEFNGIPLSGSLDSFKAGADIIVANRCSEELRDVENKVFTRDLFARD